MRAHTTLFLALLGIAGIAGATKGYDVVMKVRDKSGKTITANIDHKQAKEARSLIKKGAASEKLLDIMHASRQQIPAVGDPGGGEEPQEGFKVTFAVEDESAGEGWFWDPWKVYVTQGGEYGNSYYNYAYTPWEEGEWWGCYVPEGTYYVILATAKINDDRTNSYSHFIVKNAVEIKSDTTITFRQSDAKNMLTSDFSFPNGEKMDYVGRNEDRRYFGYFRCLNDGNGAYCFNAAGMGAPTDTVFVNDLGESWTYAINQIGIDANGSYVNKLVVPGPFNTDRHFTNNPEDYRETTANFNTLPITDKKIKGHGISTFMTWMGVDWDAGVGSVVLYDGEYTDNVKLWINSPRSNMSRSTGYDVFAAPIVAEKVDTVYYDWGDGEIYEEYQATTAQGAYMVAETSGAPYLHIDGSINGGYQKEGYPEETFYLPAISPFNYISAENNCLTMAPAMSVVEVRNFYNEWREKDFLFFTHQFSYPGFGEVNLPVVFTFTNNNNTEVIDVNGFWDWCNEGNYVPGPTVINLDAIYSNEDGVERHTKGVFSFDSSTAEEMVDVPTVTRWQLRDADNKMTAEASAAATLIFGSNIEASATLSYAEEGTNVWVELPLTQEDGIFKASLSAIDSSLEGKPLDLKFNLATIDGFTSEQTIEGAFVFKSTSGIENINGIQSDILVEGRSIIAPEEAAVYTVAGIPCGKTNLTPGLYIVTLPNRSVKVIVK